MSMRSWQKGARFFLFLICHEIKQESAIAALCCELWAQHSSLFICSTAKGTHFSNQPSHLCQRSWPTYGWCYLLWGSCSSYSSRNNGINFLKFEWEREVGRYPYYCNDVISAVCALKATFLWEGGRWDFCCSFYRVCPKAVLCLSFTRTFVRLNHQTVCGLETWFSWKETPSGLFCFPFLRSIGKFFLKRLGLLWSKLRKGCRQSNNKLRRFICFFILQAKTCNTEAMCTSLPFFAFLHVVLWVCCCNKQFWM